MEEQYPRAETHWRFCDQSTSLFISRSLPQSRRWEQSHFLCNYLELMRVMSKKVALSARFCASIHPTDGGLRLTVCWALGGADIDRRIPRRVQNYTLPSGLIQCLWSFWYLSRTDFSDRNLHKWYQCYFTTRLLSFPIFLFTKILFQTDLPNFCSASSHTREIHLSRSGTQSSRFWIMFA